MSEVENFSLRIPILNFCINQLINWLIAKNIMTFIYSWFFIVLLISFLITHVSLFLLLLLGCRRKKKTRFHSQNTWIAKHFTSLCSKLRELSLTWSPLLAGSGDSPTQSPLGTKQLPFHRTNLKAGLSPTLCIPKKQEEWCLPPTSSPSTSSSSGSDLISSSFFFSGNAKVIINNWLFFQIYYK